MKQVVVTSVNLEGTTELVFSKDLPNVEKALLKLARAINLLEKKGLSKNEILRFRARFYLLLGLRFQDFQT